MWPETVFFTAMFAFAFAMVAYAPFAEAKGWPVGAWFANYSSFPMIMAAITLLAAPIAGFVLLPWWTPLVIVVGGFFGGLTLTRALRHNVQVTAVIGLVTLWIVAAAHPFVSPGSAWTEHEKKNAQYVLLAFREEQAATHLLNRDSGFMEPGVARLWREHLQRAYEYAQTVEDGVLDKVNLELREHWRGEFQEGLRLSLLNAAAPGNMEAEIRGQALSDRFGDWWNANKRAIKIPKM